MPPLDEKSLTGCYVVTTMYYVRTNYTSRDIQPKMRLLRLLCVRVSIYRRRRRYRAAAAEVLCEGGNG